MEPKTQIKTKEATNNTWKRDYAVILGFIKGCGDNLRVTLCSKYYEQLEEETFNYKRIWPTQYIEELRTKWVFLDEVQKKAMVDHYHRGIGENEHVRHFKTRLDKEQTRMDEDGVEITPAAKMSHYILEMYNSNRFSEPVMTKYEGRSAAKRTWDKTTGFFERRTAELDKFELTNGNGEKPNEFAGATIELKQQLERAIDIIQQKDEEHALAIKEARSESQELREQIRSFAGMVDKLSGDVKRKFNRQTKRREPTPSPESSNEESSSDEDEPPSPPRKRTKKQKSKKGKGKKANKSFAGDKKYKPGTQYNVEWEKKDKLFFHNAMQAYWKTDTQESRADELKACREASDRIQQRKKDRKKE